MIFCKSGGCSAKLGPKVLSKVLSKLPKFEDENLLVGFDSSDDASVYKLTDDIELKDAFNDFKKRYKNKIKYSYNIMSEDWFLLVEAFFL